MNKVFLNSIDRAAKFRARAPGLRMPPQVVYTRRAENHSIIISYISVECQIPCFLWEDCMVPISIDGVPGLRRAAGTTTTSMCCDQSSWTSIQTMPLPSAMHKPSSSMKMSCEKSPTSLTTTVLSSTLSRTSRQPDCRLSRGAIHKINVALKTVLKR